ncbi:MAG: hypothetical protein PWQ57_1925 [Desulfovibrionales bacterium]|nr:hypothetical protein [Desulfovibrionales bacterium]
MQNSPDFVGGVLRQFQDVPVLRRPPWMHQAIKQDFPPAKTKFRDVKNPPRNDVKRHETTPTYWNHGERATASHPLRCSGPDLNRVARETKAVLRRRVPPCRPNNYFSEPVTHARLETLPHRANFFSSERTRFLHQKNTRRTIQKTGALSSSDTQPLSRHAETKNF